MASHRRIKPLLPTRIFVSHVLRSASITALMVAVALGIGGLGYHYIADLPWIDAFLNASMILTGMGPVDEIKTTAAKLFAMCYAIFSGFFFLSAAGFLLAPLAKRVMHKLHLDIAADEEALAAHSPHPAPHPAAPLQPHSAPPPSNPPHP